MVPDAELLRRYVEEKSEAAFTELVHRHLGLVYATALHRLEGDAHLAEEVTQAVFTALAQKAASLRAHPVLSGWLHRSTRYAAINTRRGHHRRAARELPLAAMNEPPAAPAVENDWQEIRPVLDSLLDRLGERERGAVILRFFENRTFAEIGAQLRLTEDAARMCVSRALEKLRESLARHGIASTASALGVALAQHHAVAVPAGLAASAAHAALASVAVGTVVAGSSGTLATAFALLTMNKIKTAIVAAIVIGALGTAVHETRAARDLHRELSTLRAGQHPEDLVRLQRENQRLAASLNASTTAPEVRELAQVRQRIAAYKARPPGVLDSEMKPLRNAGRDTPAAAFETFCWAMQNRDLATLASLVAFNDDTLENRAAFLAKFSPAVVARHVTPENICMAACGFTSGKASEDPVVAVQLLSSREDRVGQVTVRLWVRQASGRESEIRDGFRHTPSGWSLPFSLTDEKMTASLRAMLDPVTADPIFKAN